MTEKGFKVLKIGENPYSFTYFVFDRIMYWTDWGYHPKIERADMSGKQRVALVNSRLSWPNGLTLDTDKNRLYWVDARFDKLEYLNLSTNMRVTLISSSATLPHPFGLTLLGDYLYWTDWRNYAVYRANKNSADVSVFVTGIGKPTDIQGYNLSEKTTPGEEKAFSAKKKMFVLLIVSCSGIFRAKKSGSDNDSDVGKCLRKCVSPLFMKYKKTETR